MQFYLQKVLENCQKSRLSKSRWVFSRRGEEWERDDSWTERNLVVIDRFTFLLVDMVSLLYTPKLIKLKNFKYVQIIWYLFLNNFNKIYNYKLFSLVYHVLQHDFEIIIINYYNIFQIRKFFVHIYLFKTKKHVILHFLNNKF